MEMGCMNNNKSILYKKLNSRRRIDKRILFTCLVSSMLIIATSPLVMAATEDSVIITFNPDGDIDIDVNLSSYNFSSIVAGTWGNSTGNNFLLWNNGSVAMNTEIKTNDSTDEGDMALNLSTAPPDLDQYAIYIKDLNTMNQYVNNTYGFYGNYSTNLAPDDNDAFDICLFLGNLSANHTWQTTTIYFQGSQS